MSTPGNGATAVRTYEIDDPRQIKQPVLPKGRVEAVLRVDQRLRSERPNQAWRIGFDRAVFERDEDATSVPLRLTVARVAHCLSAMWSVVDVIRSLGLQVVAIRKEEDDRMVVGLWKNPHNPPVKEVEARGFTVRIEEIPPGSQPAYSEWMAVVEEQDAFKA